MQRTSLLTIQTPEGILFSQQLAGPVTRFLAWWMDLVCIIGISAVLGGLLGTLKLISPDLWRAMSILLYFSISIGYSMLMEWYWRGQTIGKRLFRLRVVDAQGLRLQFSQIALRNLLRFVDILPSFYLVGGLACLLSRRAQRLGDLAANTVVVRHPKMTEPDLAQVLAGKYNSLRVYPHLVARLRQRVSPAEAALALQALLRRNSLAPQPRVELFRQLARHFKNQVAFPAEALEGIADEQYVRNVVDVLYCTRSANPLPSTPTAHPEPTAYANR